MNETFRCDDKETLVAYLYGEIDLDGRREVDRHLRTCAACSEEVDGLRAVRLDLASWQPPEADLGFTIARKPATVLQPSRWSSPGALPAWAQVAAAVLVLAAGAAIANVQVRYNNDGLTVTTGWMAADVPVAAVVPAASPAVPSEDWKPALASLETSLRTELSQMKRTGAPQVVAARSPEASDVTAILRRVEAMLGESEQRQRQELALRLTQTRRELDMQRRGDLMNINQLYGALQARTFAVQAGQQETMNLVRRASTQPNQ